MDETPLADVMDFIMYRREIGFAECDRITRSTGVLTKIISVNDLSHVSLLSGTDARFQAVLREASAMSEAHYPQMLDRAVLINLPYVFNAMWSVVKNILSAKARSKVTICPGNTLRGDISKCPFASKFINPRTLPSFLGGECRCKGGCISGTPNEQTTLLGKQDVAGMTAAKVAARDKLEVFRDVDPGDKVAWQLVVEGQGVEVAVTLRTRILKAKGAGAHTPLSSQDLVVVPKFKHRGQEGVKAGVVVAPAKGVLVFTFDNSYSYMNSKAIKYWVDEAVPAAPSPAAAVA
jgi:hypothetical protein